MSKKIKSIVILLLILSASACQDPSTGTYKDSFISMGTFIDVAIITKDRLAADLAIQEIHKLFDRLDNLMSLYKDASPINLLNKEARKRWTKVDEELFDIIDKSVYFSQITDGAFDITVGPITELWGFGANKDVPIPSKKEILSRLQYVGYKNIMLDKKNRMVKFSKDRVKIDLGGIAKGFALSKAILILKKYDIKNALINAGGNIYCLGKNGFKGWTVGIRNPLDKEKIVKEITLKDRAIATSGGYENFFVKEGKRYCHIVDPRTGLPIENSILSVSVISQDPTLTDALSTAVFVLGLEDAKKVLDRLSGVEIFVVIKEDGGYKIVNRL